MKTMLITLIVGFTGILMADHLESPQGTDDIDRKLLTLKRHLQADLDWAARQLAVRTFENYEKNALDQQLIDKTREYVRAGYIRTKHPKAVPLKYSCEGSRCSHTFMVVLGYAHSSNLNKGARTIAAIVEVDAGEDKGTVKQISVGPDHCQK